MIDRTCSAKRTETVALFAQAVYLLFSAVYICKETLEHALLSAGDAGHHHHHSPGQDLSSSGYASFYIACCCSAYPFTELITRQHSYGYLLSPYHYPALYTKRTTLFSLHLD